jgi:hypothetical protein
VNIVYSAARVPSVQLEVNVKVAAADNTYDVRRSPDMESEVQSRNLGSPQAAQKATPPWAWSRQGTVPWSATRMRLQAPEFDPLPPLAACCGRVLMQVVKMQLSYPGKQLQSSLNLMLHKGSIVQDSARLMIGPSLWLFPNRHVELDVFSRTQDGLEQRLFSAAWPRPTPTVARCCHRGFSTRCLCLEGRPGLA